MSKLVIHFCQPSFLFWHAGLWLKTNVVSNFFLLVKLPANWQHVNCSWQERGLYDNVVVFSQQQHRIMLFVLANNNRFMLLLNEWLKLENFCHFDLCSLWLQQQLLWLYFWNCCLPFAVHYNCSLLTFSYVSTRR